MNHEQASAEADSPRDGQSEIDPPEIDLATQKIDTHADTVSEAAELAFQPDMVILYVQTGPSPHVIPYKNQPVVVGRQIPDGDAVVDLDLTPNGGINLGVSRRHLEIEVVNRQCYITDLSSSNGTWIEQQKLIPGQPTVIRNGEQFRLGSMECSVYLSNSEFAQKLLMLTPKDKSSRPSKAEGIPVQMLSGQVLPVIEALNQLQQIIYQAQKQTIPALAVSALSYDTPAGAIAVSLLNATKIISSLPAHLRPPAQAEHTKLLQATEEIDTNQLDAPEGEEITPDDNAEDFDQAIARALLDQHVSRIWESGKEEHVDKLADWVSVILESELSMSVVDITSTGE